MERENKTRAETGKKRRRKKWQVHKHNTYAHVIQILLVGKKTDLHMCSNIHDERARTAYKIPARSLDMITSAGKKDGIAVCGKREGCEGFRFDIVGDDMMLL